MYISVYMYSVAVKSKPRISKLLNFRGKRRLSHFFVYDREIQEIYKASNHLSCRIKIFSRIIKIYLLPEIRGFDRNVLSENEIRGFATV